MYLEEPSCRNIAMYALPTVDRFLVYDTLYKTRRCTCEPARDRIIASRRCSVCARNV